MIELTVIFVIYLLVIFAIGGVAYFRTRDHSDYILGGRNLSGAIAALGAGASDMSGWLMMGLPGAVYLMGVNQIWMPIGLTIGAYVNWSLVAKRLRIYTEVAKDSLTIPAFFSNRFHDHDNILRMVTAIVIIFFFTVYSAAGFVGGAQLFVSTFKGITYQHGLFLSAIVIVVYTMIGGFLAVNWVDFFQGTLMFFALLIVPIITFMHLGGLDHLIDALHSAHPGYLNVWSGVSGIGVVSLLAWGLGYFGQPHILVRFMAVRTPKDIPLARRICMSWMILSLIGAVGTGVAGMAYFTSPLANSETVFIVLSRQLFPPIITGILLSAVLSAIMSTIAAQLLASSSSLAEDFYHARFRPNASQRELLWVGRITVFMVAVVAYCIAMDSHNSILSLVSHAWAGLGASFGPVVLVSLFWKRMTRRGALFGIILAAITVVVWWLILRPALHGIFDLYELVPGFIAGLIGIYIGSMKEKPTPEMEEEFDRMLSKL